MAIMLEEIDLLDLPDFFNRMPLEYPTYTIPNCGPFSQPDMYEVRCGSLTDCIDFYWDGALVGSINKHDSVWPHQTLPHITVTKNSDNITYFYYATGKDYRKMFNDIEGNIIYCYPIQRLEIKINCGITCYHYPDK